MLFGYVCSLYATTKEFLLELTYSVMSFTDLIVELLIVYAHPLQTTHT